MRPRSGPVDKKDRGTKGKKGGGGRQGGRSPRPPRTSTSNSPRDPSSGRGGADSSRTGAPEHPATDPRTLSAPSDRGRGSADVAHHGRSASGEEGEGAAPQGDSSHRGVSLDFLIEFTWEHNAWHTPTEEVVRSIIIPAVLSDQPHSDQPSSPSQACVSPVSSPVAGSRSLQPRSPGAPTKNRTTGAVPSDAEATRAAVPYTALLEPHQVGPPEIFVSHAWSNPFGLLVAACRKLVSDSDKLPRRDKSLPLYIWVDVFAVTQQAGEAQRCDLAGLEPTIARPECTTLVVLDAEAAVPLTRIWCIFEIYATILTANGRHGKLRVRVGSLSSTQLGEFEPCSDRDRLGELASQVEVTKAEATVAADKAMILSRLRDLGAEGRDGTHELNRKLIRAVRHGW